MRELKESVQAFMDDKLDAFIDEKYDLFSGILSKTQLRKDYEREIRDQLLDWFEELRRIHV